MGGNGTRRVWFYVAMLAVFFVNGTIGAYTLDFPRVVSSFEPLDKQEKLLYVEDRTTNDTIASIYSGETREEKAHSNLKCA